MTAGLAAPANPKGVPSLEGALLVAYRFVWFAVAACAMAVAAIELFRGDMPAIILAARLAKSVIVGAVAVLLFWRRSRDPVAAILAIAFLCWIVTSSFDFNSGEILPRLVDRLRFLLFVLALFLFPDGNWVPAWTRPVAVASLITFTIGLGEALGVLGTRLFLPVAILCVLAAIGSLIQRFRTASDDIQKQQLKWVALGLVSGVGAILAARGGAALTAAPLAALEVLFQLGIVLIAIGFLVPLLRYRLYDAETVISRSAAYAGLTAALVATFAASEALIEAFGQQFLGQEASNVSGAIAAAVAAMLLTPLHARISNWAEARFQADLVELKAGLPELLLDMPSRWSPEDVARAALPRIAEAVHASRMSLILDGRTLASHGSGGARSNDEAQYPVRLPIHCPFGGSRGWLCLGPRPDGSLYGGDEMDALTVILSPLRRRLIGAEDRANESLRDDEIWQDLNAQLAQFTTRLSRVENVVCARR